MNQTKIDIKPVAIILLLISAGWFLTWYFYQSNANKLRSELLERDYTVDRYMDKYERETVKVASIELDNKDLKMLVLEYRAKYEIEKMKPARVISIGSEKIVTRDTLYLKTDSTYIVDGKPVYHVTDSTQWHWFDIWAGSDSSRINYSINNSFVSWHQNDAKWYERDKFNFYTINLNPNTRTQDKIHYQANGSRKYVVAWFAVGLIGGLLIK